MGLAGVVSDRIFLDLILTGARLPPGLATRAKERGEIFTGHIGLELYTAAIDGSGGRMGQEPRGCTGKTVAEVPGSSKTQVQHTYAGTEANSAESKHTWSTEALFSYRVQTAEAMTGVRAALLQAETRPKERRRLVAARNGPLTKTYLGMYLTSGASHPCRRHSGASQLGAHSEATPSPPASFPGPEPPQLLPWACRLSLFLPSRTASRPILFLHARLPTTVFSKQPGGRQTTPANNGQARPSAWSAK